MAYLKFALVLLASAALFFLGFAWLYPSHAPEATVSLLSRLFDPLLSLLNVKHAVAGEVSALGTLLLFLAMLVGTVAKSLHGEVEQAPGRQVSAKVFKQAFQSHGFYLSLIVSPIVFLAVYRTAGLEPDRLVALLLSFQNGFFWKTILEGVKPGAQ